MRQTFKPGAFEYKRVCVCVCVCMSVCVCVCLYLVAADTSEKVRKTLRHVLLFERIPNKKGF